MKAKSIFCLAVFAMSVMLLSNCKKDRTKHSREISDAQNIRGIVVEGSWSVYLRQGEQSSAKIEYSAFLDDKIEARVDNDGYLYLKVRRSIGITRDDLKAVVTIPKIEYIKASGASHIHSEGIFEGKTNKIELNGASKINSLTYRGNDIDITLNGASKINSLTYRGNDIDITLNGASRCNMSGMAERAKIEANGSSEAAMPDFTTKTLEIYLNGSSDAFITITERATGKLSGASKLRYRGNADLSGVQLSGASSIQKAE